MKLERAFDILFHQLETLPRPDCLSAKTGGQWQSLSSTEVMEAVNAVSLGLLQQGLVDMGRSIGIAGSPRCLMQGCFQAGLPWEGR